MFLEPFEISVPKLFLTLPETFRLKLKLEYILVIYFSNFESFKKIENSCFELFVHFFSTHVRFLGVGKNFRLLMQSCCFFFSRPFHENFKFLKNCPYDFHEILHSHSTPKGAPACAKASKSYGWDVRNIAKISPKMSKKTVIFRFFRFSHKLFIRFERKRVRRKKT